MNPACACGSPRTIRHGSDSGSHLRLAGGIVERVAGTFQRYLCKGCGRTFTHRPAEVDADERQVRERAAELAFALGRAPAARRLDLHHSVLDNLLDDWQACRDPDTVDAEPDFLFVESVVLRKETFILVADLDRESLVEVLPDPDRVGAWLTRPDRLPALRVCVPIDPAVAGAVRSALPDAIVMVAPSAVLRAIRGALTAGLGVLRRLPGMRSRNAFPSTARFLRAVEGGGPRPEGWPHEVMGLLGAGRLAREIVGGGDAARGAALWPEFELAASVQGGLPLGRLMATWKGAILSGMDHRFVDRIAQVLDQVRRLAQARRPTLVFQDFRGLVLLRDYERVPVMVAMGSQGASTKAHGRPLSGLVDLLRQPALVVAGGGEAR